MYSESEMNLNDAQIGKQYSICYIDYTDTAYFQRFFDLGFIKNSIVIPMFDSMFCGCRAYCVKGSIIAVRNKDAKNIYCKLLV